MANKSIYMAPLTPYLMKPFKITILQQSLTCISLIRSCSWHLRTTLRDLQCALMPMRRLSSNINWWKTVLTIKQYQMVLFAPVVIILALIAMQHPILKHQTLPTLPTLRTLLIQHRPTLPIRHQPTRPIQHRIQQQDQVHLHQLPFPWLP